MSKNNENIKQWLYDNKVQDVEVLVSDFAGIGRGKKMPVNKFINTLGTDELRLPDSLFAMTIDCDFIGNEYITDVEGDVFLAPDFSTVGLVPWCENVTAFFICDVLKKDGSPHNTSPRQVLKSVLSLYEKKGLKPIIAPEFEFTLIAGGEGSDFNNPPKAPTGKSGRTTIDKGVLSMDGVAEFGTLFDDVRRYCELMGLPMDALVQEAGVGQFEFNIAHGEALELADSSFHFKRVMKWVAVQNGLQASFMAKPYPDDFGNSMHIHQSIVDIKTGLNIFADENGKNTNLFLSYIGGLQKYVASSMLFFTPYDNSYLRLSSALSSPVNTHWGFENRSVGLRVPDGGRAARRVENRIAGSDANPYLVIAGSLLCGYLGMIEGLEPSDEITGSAYGLKTNRLPQNIYASYESLENSDEIRGLLGDEFIQTYLDVKKAEIKARSNVLSSWDIKYLLTNV